MFPLLNSYLCLILVIVRVLGSYTPADLQFMQPVTHNKYSTRCSPAVPERLPNNLDAEKCYFQMVLAYYYLSCSMIFCTVSFSAFRAFLICRKQEQDGQVWIKYLFSPRRKHKVLTQSMYTNYPNTEICIAPLLLQLCTFPVTFSRDLFAWLRTSESTHHSMLILKTQKQMVLK